MTVRYVRVNPVSDMFAPAVRAYGNVAVVGRVTPPAAPPADLLAVGDAVVFTDPAEARRRAPGALGDAISLAFNQIPGPTQVTGVRVDTAAPDWALALDTLSTRDVQIVTLADTPLDTAAAAAGGAVRALADHVVGVSNTGGDGRERIGVAMLEKAATDPTIVSGALASERMVFVAHKSDEDVAAAVAGTIAGYEPHVSLLLKPVKTSSEAFTAAEIDQLNGSETFASGPAGQGVNWLVDPALIPGQGLYLGEGYTGDPGGGKKYIDVVRTIDNVSFLLKAQLIRTIGNVRVSRSGLRTLGAQLEAVLDPLVRQGVIEGYDVIIPILGLLDKPVRTAAEDQQVDDAQSQRVVEVLVAVDYAGAIHRVALTLKFE
ncbi:hypothetical protein [Cellulomonas fengjieae]|uniref:Tail sheath protein subtilisin-like domain-containing protein n=1 Tax=Cellulomonas fengjieae TaxID=2819978 RepID=A0ABS3SIS6_9CELL|nr:hypothetical protein [Cellulomonas fengjieae]MBO3084861.1 hypothetical protein [Cellulomonas fengjieae]MBO3103826.1 hypothetical protein [Cellulomonas fengjieae]QVI66825.1 hypothetical protein KG102_04350 [Cellulomonas fengjieae]